MDLQVLVIDPATRRASFSIQPKIVEGVDKLLQLVILTLMTSPGSDILEPSLGSGLPDLIGANIDTSDSSELRAEVSRKVSKAQTDIINDQIGLDLPAEERLRSLSLLSVQAVPEEGRIDVRLRVENELGRTRDVVI